MLNLLYVLRECLQFVRDCSNVLSTVKLGYIRAALDAFHHALDLAILLGLFVLNTLIFADTCHERNT